MGQTKKMVDELIQEIKSVAVKYYDLTGKPLGATGEIGELIASQKLGLKLMNARNEGFDAIKEGVKYEIKTRMHRQGAKNFNSQRTSKINLDAKWDKLLLVILSETFDLIEILELDKKDVKERLEEPGSKARNEKRTLSINDCKRLSSKRIE